MNRCFNEMTEAIRSYGGHVLQHAGDEIEAVFGVPVSAQRHARMVLNAALEMRSRLEKLNKAMDVEEMPAFQHGLGIHTGPVPAGNIGTPDRLSYTMVGTTVNLASRVQEVNRTFGTDILIATQTRAALGGGFNLTGLKPVKVIKVQIASLF